MKQLWPSVMCCHGISWETLRKMTNNVSHDDGCPGGKYVYSDYIGMLGTFAVC
jgi:hypothetical protein